MPLVFFTISRVLRLTRLTRLDRQIPPDTLPLLPPAHQPQQPDTFGLECYTGDRTSRTGKAGSAPAHSPPPPRLQSKYPPVLPSYDSHSA
eukprot:5799625-Pyramimonas_sp.AAC.1